MKSWRSLSFPLECFPTKFIPVKLILAQKRGRLAREVTGVYCQKNGNPKIFLLATQKDNKSKEQREKKNKRCILLGN